MYVAHNLVFCLKIFHPQNSMYECEFTLLYMEIDLDRLIDA